MSAAPDDIAGFASSADSIGTESGSSAGTTLGMTLAISTLIVWFTSRKRSNYGYGCGEIYETDIASHGVVDKHVTDHWLWLSEYAGSAPTLTIACCYTVCYSIYGSNGKQRRYSCIAGNIGASHSNSNHI